MNPNDFYKSIRPECFSDSEIIFETELTKEVLSYELETISTNQKQDQFERLARLLCEKYISPNLIPQVGPTGGGDGKTDSETHPVSNLISDRWYINNENFANNEKWAFAISAKKDWNSKLKGDVKSILSTKRGYSKIFFITNQKVSSKKKKDVQDLLNDQHKIELTILDGQWIEDKIINDKLYDLAVDTLGLATVYKSKQIIRGSKDNERLTEAKLLEDRLILSEGVNSQLVEDCLRAAVLSRELEESNFVIEGKFLRAINFAKKIISNLQILRIYYEYSWTSMFWFNDIEKFKDNFEQFIALVDKTSHIDQLELFCNLLTVARSHSEEIENFVTIQNRLYFLLQNKINVSGISTSGLRAKTYLLLNMILDNSSRNENCDFIFDDLTEVVNSSADHLGYPFESILESIKVIGEAFPISNSYDNMYDVLVDEFGKRTSSIYSGRNFLGRAFQKFEADLYEDSIIYLGKSIIKISKNDNEFELILILRLLGNCYRNIGMLWAANNALLSALALSLKSWYSKGTISEKAYHITAELFSNEILLGRVPQLLSLNELIKVLYIHTGIGHKIRQEEKPEFFEMMVAVRFLNSDYNQNLSKLPDLLISHEMWSSSDAVLYLLGYENLILEQEEYNGRSPRDLDEYMKKLANQPLNTQFLYPTTYLSESMMSLNAKILGVNFYIKFKKDKFLLTVSEMILAYFESFLATSLRQILPHSESINIHLEINNNNEVIEIIETDSSKEFTVKIDKTKFFDYNERDNLNKKLLELTVLLIGKNFMFKNHKDYLNKIFENEEVLERIAIVFNHKGFVDDIFTAESKVFLEDWNKIDFKEFPLKVWRKINIEEAPILEKHHEVSRMEMTHNKTKVISVIDNSLWDSARWDGFGYAAQGQYFVGATLHFQDFNAGKKIFQEWKKQYGEGINNEIGIAIIKGINKNNPYWYRVLITPFLDGENRTNGIFTVSSRFHLMESQNPNNLLQIIKAFENFGFLPLLPATTATGAFELDSNSLIKIKNLSVKNAWEIDINDIEQVAILEDDEVVIPVGVKEVPVLKVIERKKNK